MHESVKCPFQPYRYKSVKEIVGIDFECTCADSEKLHMGMSLCSTRMEFNIGVAILEDKRKFH